MKALLSTDFSFEDQKSRYQGKVRDVYSIGDDYLVMVATDRISAFDVVLPEGIPYKGQVLNQIASKFLDATSDIIPNWKIAEVDPMATVGYRCEPFKVEMVVRGYLTGHAWREYKAGRRSLCGVALPDGMVENQKFPRGIVSADDYARLEEYTLALYRRGCEMAAQKGLILVDTKYEFGKRDGQIMLMDEIHTPDSSRYFYADGYEQRLASGERQRQLSKEFVREWLMAGGFQGLEGQKVPEMTPAVVKDITDRYVELYEHITGEKFSPAESDDPAARIESNIRNFLETHKNG